MAYVIAPIVDYLLSRNAPREHDGPMDCGAWYRGRESVVLSMNAMTGLTMSLSEKWL